jgi:Short C-terminal domain
VPPPRRHPQTKAIEPQPAPAGRGSEAERAEALAKLKSLLDSGILTEEQYESERQRITRRG